ncbi:hypothetical protein pdam_00024223, partial [Pocillopora damicornis]
NICGHTPFLVITYVPGLFKIQELISRPLVIAPLPVPGHFCGTNGSLKFKTNICSHTPFLVITYVPGLLKIPRTNFKTFGDRTFARSRPLLLNKLLLEIQNSQCSHF